jgi:hypothetical protein
LFNGILMLPEDRLSAGLSTSGYVGSWTQMSMTGAPFFSDMMDRSVVAIGNKLIVLGIEMPMMNNVGGIYQF